MSTEKKQNSKRLYKILTNNIFYYTLAKIGKKKWHNNLGFL